MSGLIFVALFAAWAIYLVPRALQAHDEMARTRSVQSFSNRLRTFGHASAKDEDDAPATPVVVAPVIASARDRRVAARKAAARRRRVLLALVMAGVVVGGVAAAGYLPLWSLAIPVAAVVGFLAIARLSVRASRPKAAVEAAPIGMTAAATLIIEEVEETETSMASPHSVEVAAEDDGLWDPLPVTLPSYVTKPSARRTIRSIELTGIVSSGHDEEDSRLARDAEAALMMDAAPERRIAGA